MKRYRTCNEKFISKTVLMVIKKSQTVASYGGLDILVSNAAVNPTFGPVLQVSSSDVNYFKTFDFHHAQL